MELIQIIESTVFFFSLGLLILLILSYLLFKIKNQYISIPAETPGKVEDLKITYEKPAEENNTALERKMNSTERFIVVNETMRQESPVTTVNSWRQVNPRFYVYKPGRNKIVTNLQLSGIKD